MKRLLVLAALGAAAFSNAQPIEPPTNVAFRLGGAFVWDDNARDVSETMVGFGFDYFLPRGLLPEGETFISIDWLGRALDGGKGNIFPVALNHRFFMTQGEFEWQRTYFFAGIGPTFMDLTTATTVLGIRGGVGQYFGPHIFGEVSATLSEAVDGKRANTIGVFVGYRFH